MSIENMKCQHCGYEGLPWFDACPKCGRGNIANDLLEILKGILGRFKETK